MYFIQQPVFMKIILSIIFMIPYFFLKIFAHESNLVFQEKDMILDFKIRSRNFNHEIHLFYLNINDSS